MAFVSIVTSALLRDDTMRPPLPYDMMRPRLPYTSKSTCSPKLISNNSDAPAHDLAQTHEPQTADECIKACCNEPRCGGVLFQPIAKVTWSACIAGKPCCFLKTAIASTQPWPSPFPGGSFVYEMTDRPQDDEKLHFLSATLGSHMVLQQAPHSATIWGFTQAGARVETTMTPSDATRCKRFLRAPCEAQTLVTFAEDDGTWRQKLPPTLASKAAFDFRIVASNETVASLAEAAIVDVLFGEVFICGGQSNMEFGMPTVTNATAEQQRANAYPTIRLYSVGHSTASASPLRDLQTVWEPWQVASNETICKDLSGNLFATFSASCWFFGRMLSEALSPEGDVPIGLISNNWGGTKLEVWVPAAALAECNATSSFTPGDGPMWNAMILPYTVGPMAIAGFAWYQGEADTASEQSAALYGCTFPSLIRHWRAAFHSPYAYFGFVQLSTWCALPPESLPQMRAAQMRALELDHVGYATGADHGMGCNIHQGAKQFVGERLARAALAIQYGREDVAWRSPTYKRAVPTTFQLDGGSSDGIIGGIGARGPGIIGGIGAAASVSVRVSLNDVSDAGLYTVYPANYLPPNYAEVEPTPVDCFGTFVVNATYNASMTVQCAWAALLVEGAGWLNATVTVPSDDLRSLLLTAQLPPARQPPAPWVAAAPAVMGSAYGWGPIPMMNVYDKGTGLPVLGWNESMTPP